MRGWPYLVVTRAAACGLFASWSAQEFLRGNGWGAAVNAAFAGLAYSQFRPHLFLPEEEEVAAEAVNT